MSRIEISKKRVLINSASSAISLILNLSVLIWLQQFLLKRISPEEYSLIPILLSVMALTPLFTTIFTSGIGRYITIAYAKHDDDEIVRICSTMFPILLFVCLLFISVGWTAAWHIDSLIVIEPGQLKDARIMFALLVFSAAIRLPLSVFGAGFIVTQKLYQEDIINVFIQLIRVGFLFSLLYGVSTRVLWVVVSSVSSELVLMAIVTPLSIKLLPTQRIQWNGWRKPIAKEIIGYGGWGFVNQIAETVKQAFDPLILNRFVTAVAVSTYYVAGLVPRQLKLVLVPFARPFIPILSAMCATEDYIKLGNTYLRVARYHAWIILSIAIPAIAFSDEIIFLYLDGLYPDASKIMRILIIVTLLDTFNALGPPVVAADGRIKEYSICKLLMYIVNIILTIFFVVYLQEGAFGAAMATLLSVLLVDTTLTWSFCRKVAHVSIGQWYKEVVYPCLGSAMPSIFFCMVMSDVVVLDSWFRLIAVSFTSMILFYIIVAGFGLREQDKIDLGRLVNKRNLKREV